MMSQAVFCGAGTFAAAHLGQWISIGIVPVCFVDSDENKHNKIFQNEKIPNLMILPLEEADKRWPDADWYVTVLNDSCSVHQTLLDYGIESGRIHYLRHNGIIKQPLASQKWCPFLGNWMQVYGAGICPCCEEQRFHIRRTKSIKDDIADFIKHSNSLKQALEKGLYSSCTGCYRLLDGENVTSQIISEANIGTGLAGGTKCNFKCIYCAFRENNKNREFIDWSFEEEENVFDIIKCLDEDYQVTTFHYSSGELMVSPYRDKILDLWTKRKWSGTIFTNASIYSDKVADLLSNGLISIRCSLDAGTSDTFARIKGVDCFGKVLDNLRKYAHTCGKIELKYIVLEGLNDNYADMEGFVDFSLEINASVVLSVDHRISCNMSKKVYDSILYLSQLLSKQHVGHVLQPALVSPEDISRLMSSGLKIR